MINKIYVNGGSQCIAAGFMLSRVKDVYKNSYNITIENHLEYAYPNLLAKKLNVEIVNEGAPGGSINRMVRKTYEHIFENDCANTFFILEIPPGWRDEFYSIELKRFVNMNVLNILSADDETDIVNGNDPKDLHKIHKDINNFFYNFIDDKIEQHKTMLNLLGLVSYLKLHNLKYIIMDSGDFHTYLVRKSQPTIYNFVWFNDKFEYPMWQWAQENNYLIKNETNGLSNDEHFGIEGNKLIADKLYKIVSNYEN